MRSDRNERGITREDLVAIIAALGIIIVFLTILGLVIHHNDEMKAHWGMHVNKDSVCSEQYSTKALAVTADNLPWGCEGSQNHVYLGAPDIEGYCVRHKGLGATVVDHHSNGVYCHPK